MTTTILQNSFLPTSIPGCKLWLDGKDTSSASMTLSGTTVTTWKDKSGNGSNATGVNSPQLVSRGGVSFNAASSQYFSFSVPYTSTHTIYIVATPSSASLIYLFGRSSPNSEPAMILNYSGTSLEYYDDPDSGRQTFGSPTTTFIASYIRTPNVSVVGRLNGSEVFTEPGPTTEYSTVSWGYLGSANGSVRYYTGTIYEFMIFNASLTTLQAQQIEGYLAWKWGLQVNLPPTHPYKNSPAVYLTQPNILTNLSITNQVTNAAFLPTQISGCKLWLDAADPAGTGTVPGNSASITSWYDKSGSGNTCTNSSSSNSPVYTTNALNGLPVLSFTGPGVVNTTTSQWLDNTVMAFPNTQNTIFAVVYNNNSTTKSYTANNYIISGRSDALISYSSFTSNLFATFVGSGSAWNDINTNSPGQNMNGVWSITAMTINANVLTPYFNGTAQNTKNGAMGSTTGFIIGEAPAGYRGQCWNGYMAEILIYNNALTTTQRQQVEGYLAWKWGLQVNLPPTHPYKKTSAVLITQPSILAALSANPYNNMVTYKYFNPTSIAGITLWLDGADTTSMTLSGTNITQWRDKSGQGYNQVGYNNPQYSSLTKGITLNGTTNYFASATSGGSLRIPTATHCLVAVHSPTTISGNGTGNTSLFRFQGIVGTASTYIVFPYMYATTPRGYINSQDDTTTRYDTGGLVENSVINTPNLILANIASGSQEVYKNGNRQTSATAFLSNTTSDFFALGCQNWTYINGQQYELYSGTVYEMMVFNTTITTAQRQQIEGYLAWKWGIQANLPPTHPYKNYPPPPN